MRLVVAVVAAALVGSVLGVALARGFGGEAGAGDDGVVPRTDAVTEDLGSSVEVTVRPRTERGFVTVPVVEDLPARAVLRLRVLGFEDFDQATARQCRTVVEETRCGNNLPVQFGPRGTAVFQYLVTEDFVVPDETGTDDGCGAEEPACLVVITTLDGQRRAEVQTVFGDRLPPPGRASVHPAGRVHHGQIVTVTVEGLPPGTNATVTTCVAPSMILERRCGDPAPTASLTIGADGSGQAEVAVTRGPVGTHRLGCDDEHRCAISVIADRASVRVEPVPIVFAALPGAVYDPVRLAVGLAAASCLLGAALWLVRRTDWSAVGEAAAPEIDEAEYADLDAIVAALPADENDVVAGR